MADKALPFGKEWIHTAEPGVCYLRLQFARLSVWERLDRFCAGFPADRDIVIQKAVDEWLTREGV